MTLRAFRRLGRIGALVFVGLLVAAGAMAGSWININPGGGGGFTSIGAGPSGTIICGSDLSGAYRSLDRGSTWDAIGSSRDLARTHVSAVGGARSTTGWLGRSRDPSSSTRPTRLA